METIFFIDWDDTLFPLSWLSSHNIDIQTTTIPLLIQNQLNKLESCIMKFLDMILLLGDCYIITNSDDGWVLASAKKFLNNIIPYFNIIRVISAKTSYEKIYSDKVEWKYNAMKQITTKKFYADKNIISIGDSNTERQAVIQIAKNFNTLTKNIKLVEGPLCYQIYDQLIYLINVLTQIHNCKNNLDLQINIEY